MSQVRLGAEREDDRDLRAGGVPVPEGRLRQVLARAFGLPGLRCRPEEVPSGTALSQARELLGDGHERLFDSTPTRRRDWGSGAVEGLEVTAWTAPRWTDRKTFGRVRSSQRPGRCCGYRARPPSTAGGSGGIGSYTTGRTPWRRLERSYPRHDEPRRPRFFSMRFPLLRAGADLAWRVKNSAKLPADPGSLPDGSELVVLHESGGMHARRRGGARPPAPRLPDTVARLVTFTMTVTAAGRGRPPGCGS